jgi:two-component system, LytTR family, response regulator
MMIRTLIVDDEPKARKGIKARLQDFPLIHIIGECSSGTAAVEAIDRLQPDLVFLDIQMPELNGLEVLGKISLDQVPVIIFVTAFDVYAIKAFEYHALDYLLKPLDGDRFRSAVQNAVVEVGRRNIFAYSEKLKAMTNDYLNMTGIRSINEQNRGLSENIEFVTRFMIKTTTQISVVSADELYWIEAAGDLVYLHTRSKKHIYRDTLTALEAGLDPRKFVRIHRSAIVNIEKVKHLHPVSHGDYDLLLENETQLRLSRTHREHFQAILQKH